MAPLMACWRGVWEDWGVEEEEEREEEGKTDGVVEDEVVGATGCGAAAEEEGTVEKGEGE